MPDPIDADANLHARIRELAAELASLDRISDERTKRLESQIAAQKVAVDTALVAQKEQVAAAFAASEKAIDKSDKSQEQYNQRSNEFRQALDDSNKNKIGREEFVTTLKAIDEKLESRFGTVNAALIENKHENQLAFEQFRKDIADLRESRSAGAGGSAVHAGERSQSNWLTGLIVVGGISLLGLVLEIVRLLLGK